MFVGKGKEPMEGHILVVSDFEPSPSDRCFMMASVAILYHINQGRMLTPYQAGPSADLCQVVSFFNIIQDICCFIVNNSSRNWSEDQTSEILSQSVECSTMVELQSLLGTYIVENSMLFLITAMIRGCLLLTSTGLVCKVIMEFQFPATVQIKWSCPLSTWYFELWKMII